VPASKEEIGRSFWTLLHSTVAKLHDPPTLKERIAVRNMLNAAAETYPCEQCRPGFQWIKEHPPDFSSKKAIVEWSCQFHNAINQHLNKPIYSCDIVVNEAMSDCMTCKRTSITLTGEDLKSPSGQQTVEALLESEAKKYNIPKPKVLFQEESTFCKNTNCTIMDPRNPVSTTKIYFNPQASNFSTKSIFHEWYHYMASILGREKTKQVVKQVLGIDVQGDPDSEEEADIFALKEMENMPSITINREENQVNGSMSPEELVAVKRQELMFAGPSNVFSAIDRLYEPFTQFAKLSSSQLNAIYTPEILGTALETGYDVALTPFGQVVGNILTWIVLAGVSTLSSVGQFDRIALNEWAAHHGARIITLANPAYLSAAIGGAKAAGQAAAVGKVDMVGRQMIKNPSQISGLFRSLMSEVQSTFSGIARGGDAAEQLPQTPQQPESEPGLFQ
jgi:hypothetical protein